MYIGFLILFLVFGGLTSVMFFLKERAEKSMKLAQSQMASLTKQREEETARSQKEVKAAISNMQASYERKVSELGSELERISGYYQAEATKIAEEASNRISELEPLRAYTSIKDAETEAKRVLAVAITEATELKQEAQQLIIRTREETVEERALARERAKDIVGQAEALLTQATRDAGRIIKDSEDRAKQIGGDAYEALRDKQTLEQAVQALWNVTEGYGDRYVIPTHSLLDDLAANFGYTEAGQALRAAREQSRRMVEQKLAATCNYEEEDRRDRANRFVIDAFNGRMDAILTRAKHDNYGTLEQEIKDAYNLVNLNGLAFRDAHILSTYLDARLAELKWATVVHALARRQREEQRYLKERMRDEEKARKEYDEKMRQAAREEALKRKAVEEAEKKFAGASAEQKAQYEQELQKLRNELTEATQQKLTIAQQTKKGHVYIISNVGSFGEGIYKIGQTRRPDPNERVDELSGASVPFDFDIHGLIESENAPTLEHKIHKLFLPMQVNKMNFRKEFFRVSLAEIRQELDKLKEGEDFILKEWTEMAAATQYTESLDIESDPEKKGKWLARQKALADRQLKMDALKLAPVAPSDLETEGGGDE